MFLLVVFNVREDVVIGVSGVLEERRPSYCWGLVSLSPTSQRHLTLSIDRLGAWVVSNKAYLVWGAFYGAFTKHSQLRPKIQRV